jgi:hypothetical protein
MSVFGILQGGNLNWPDIIVAVCAVGTILAAITGGIFKVLQKIDVLIEQGKDHKDRADKHEARLDRHDEKLDTHHERIVKLEAKHQ